jgi:5'-3' exonuclease
MGIPFFFKSILTNHPDVIRACKNGTTCDHLYLDYNCIIHMMAYHLLQVVDPNTGQEAFASDVINKSLDYIDYLITFVTPTTSLFIGIDGMVPRAKMHQQRKRRYMTVWRESEMDKQNVRTDPKLWNSNVITPGTSFMQKFDSDIRAWAKKKSSKVPFTILVSTSDEFGEGEHKIYEQFKNNSHGSNVIYGLDADLILLSLLHCTPDRPITLLREAPEFHTQQDTSTKFMLLDIQSLKFNIFKHYMPEQSVDILDDFIKDYIIMCTLIGNDFLPPLSYLKIKMNGIENIMNSYKSVYSMTSQPLCSPQGLNMQLLLAIIADLAHNEDVLMCEVSKQYYDRKAFVPKTKTGKDLIDWRLDNFPSLNKFPRIIDVESKSWRLAYYKHLFGDNSHALINEVCKSYIEGISWVYEYYFTQKQNNGWYYKHSYSPSILDMHRFLSTLEESELKTFTHVKTHSTHSEFHSLMCPSLHLLMVFPPQSSSLLSANLRRIMTELSYGVLHYYPQQFEISTYLKQYLWECSIKLPDIQIDRLGRALHSD